MTDFNGKTWSRLRAAAYYALLFGAEYVAVPRGWSLQLRGGVTVECAGEGVWDSAQYKTFGLDIPVWSSWLLGLIGLRIGLRLGC